MKKLETLGFKHFCMSIGNLPSSYVESLSYYECLMWLCKFLQDTVIPTVNNNSEVVEELQGLYLELKSYVDNYFDNLDVQEEINNKLDEMTEDGTLPEIIASYLNSKAIFAFDNVADMKQATNLINGSFAQTLGYYNKNDGGGALYKITNVQSQNEYQETLNNGLYATLIVENNSVSIEQLGAQSNNEISDILQFALNKYSIVYVNNNGYLLNKPIRIPEDTKLIGKKTLTYITQTDPKYFHFKWISNEHTPIFTTVSGNVTSYVYDDYSKSGWGIENISIDGNNVASIGFLLTGQRKCTANDLTAVRCTIGFVITRSWEIHFGNLYSMYNTLGLSTVPSINFDSNGKPTWTENEFPDTALNNINIDTLCIRQCKNGAFFNLFAQSTISSFNIEECNDNSNYALYLAYCPSFFPNIHIETTNALMNNENYKEVQVYGFKGSAPSFGELMCTSIYSEIPFIINTLVCYAVIFNDNSKRVLFMTDGNNFNKPKVLCYSRIDLTQFNDIKYLPRLNPPQICLIPRQSSTGTLFTCGTSILQILLYNNSNDIQPAIENGITLSQKHGGSIHINTPEINAKSGKLIQVYVPYGTTGFGKIDASINELFNTNTDLDIMIGTDIAGIINTF